MERRPDQFLPHPRAPYLWKVGRDAWAYLLSFAVSRGQPFLEALGFSLLLSVEEFGVWSWAMGLWAGVVALTHFGVPAATFRYAALPEVDSAALLWQALREARYGLLVGSLALMALALTVPAPVRHTTLFFIPALWSQLVGEVLRSYFRGRYQNLPLARWQIAHTFLGLALVWGGAWKGALSGAAWAKAFQGFATLLLGFLLLPLPAYRKSLSLPGFWRFAWEAYVGNLALEAIFFLPAWLLGWRSQSPILLAYWRWATLLPLNLRQVAGQIVLYLYPRWVQSPASPHQLYRVYRGRLWLRVGVFYIGAALWALVWDYFPGPEYRPARLPYLFALLVSLLWSVEANLLPNLLSAKGHIHHYRSAYVVGAFTALLVYLFAGHSLYGYLLGLGLAGLMSALYAYFRAHRP